MSNLEVAKSEKDATSARGGETSSTAPSRKVRSCFVCRQRKVRCDKQLPACGNCRRADIPCVLPAANRPPRWARRQELLANNAVAASQSQQSEDVNLKERLQYLEGLVKDLREQLQQARSSYGSSTDPSPGNSSHIQDEPLSLHTSSVRDDGLDKQFGRLVVQDTGQTRYVSSGFWSRVDDELDDLHSYDDHPLGHDHSNSSEDETTPETNKNSSDSPRNAFPFQLSSMSASSNLHSPGPLPSQIPFLIEVFSESVYLFLSIVHLPSVKKIAQDIRKGGTDVLSPSDEALMFAIYHAAIVSMEENEVMSNFGETKHDLTLRYRRGLENALVNADFLNSPNVTLLQAFALFIFLIRCYDSPRYVWMMTGLLVRMAHYVGLQRDGKNFKHLRPYEIEMRRRVWWAVLLLDVRASEDQGTDTIIKEGSFDTRLPLNINDTDIDPQSKDPPAERIGLADVSTLRATSKIAHIAIQIASITGSDISANQELDRLLAEVYESFNHEHLKHDAEPGGVKYRRRLAVARINQGKLTLLAYLPTFFNARSEQGSQELRNRLLLAAIEVAEWNHMLYTEEGSVNLRWIWETYTHWYAIAFLLLETSKRPWSPMIERAWGALHCEGLFPRPSFVDTNMRIWIPVRKLMQTARKHRETEIQRLRADPLAATALATEHQTSSWSASGSTNQTDTNSDVFLERWRSLVGSEDRLHTASTCSSVPDRQVNSIQSTKDASTIASQFHFDQSQPYTYHRGTNAELPVFNVGNDSATGTQPALAAGTFVQSGSQIASSPPFNTNTLYQTTYDQSLGAWPGFANWLWADIDPSLDDLTGIDMDLDLLDPNLSSNWLNMGDPQP